MVVSSACIRVASITVAVTIPRLMTALSAGASAMSGPNDRDDVAPQFAERALVAGVDRDLGTHARAQREIVQGLIEGKADRYALHHLDPITGGILWRPSREHRTPRRGQRRRH